MSKGKTSNYQRKPKNTKVQPTSVHNTQHTASTVHIPAQNTHIDTHTHLQNNNICNNKASHVDTDKNIDTSNITGTGTSTSMCSSSNNNINNEAVPNNAEAGTTAKNLVGPPPKPKQIDWYQAVDAHDTSIDLTPLNKRAREESDTRGDTEKDDITESKRKKQTGDNDIQLTPQDTVNMDIELGAAEEANSGRADGRRIPNPPTGQPLTGNGDEGDFNPFQDIMATKPMSPTQPQGLVTDDPNIGVLPMLQTTQSAPGDDDNESILSEVSDISNMSEKLLEFAPQRDISLTPPNYDEIEQFMKTMFCARKPIERCSAQYPDLRVLLACLANFSKSPKTETRLRNRTNRLIKTLMKHIRENKQ